jgi:hypothetical protein
MIGEAHRLARKAQGYDESPIPNCCKNCSHLDVRLTHKDSPNPRAYLYCGIGGFAVTRRGLCTRHQRVSHGL